MLLEERVARLERSARRWKIVAFVAVVGLAGLGAGDGKDAVFDVVRAKTFAVVDDKGKPYAVFSSGLEKEKPGNRHGVIILEADDGSRGLLMPGATYAWSPPKQ